MVKPKTNPPLNTVDILIEALAALCLIYMVTHLIVEYAGLEDKVPTHFNANGIPNSWGSKSSLLIFPISAIVLYTGLTVLNRFPYVFNYPVTIHEQNAEKQYQYAKTLISALKFTTIGLFLYIQLQTINVANEMQVGLDTHFLIVLIIGLFIPIVVYFVIAFRNK